MAEDKSQTILVVGGGMSGLTTALEAAEAGYESVIVERNPYLGGRVAQLNQYFPKMCPPSCGLEINFKRIRSNPKIKFYTSATVEKIEGQAGNFTASIKVAPQYIKDGAGDLSKCQDMVETMVDDPFNYNMSKAKALRLPHLLAMPKKYIMDPSIVGTEEGAKIKECCPEGVDLDAKEETIEIKAGAVVWATGWDPYDARKLDTYGFGTYPNVITNVMMERLADLEGPTNGKILRPSDGEPPKTVAFVQCAGSRDMNHLPYCSGVCCLASIKQANYVLEQYPEAKVYICFIDIRAQDRLDEFYQNAQELENLAFVKSKVASIAQDDATGNVILEAENTFSGEQLTLNVDMAVLATGMAPNNTGLPEGVAQDEYGFIPDDSGKDGFIAAGVSRKPYNVAECVQDATRAALRAIQAVRR